MKKTFQILFFVLILSGLQTLHAQFIYLVDAAKTTNTIANGVTRVNANAWENACSNLQTAINAASDKDQVWVKTGTYLPALNAYFSMKQGVEIYGHFAGTETGLQQRDLLVEASKTILQGNGNSVIYNTGLTAGLLDGFTVTGGTGNQSGTYTYGGGMYNTSSYITVRNCIFQDNHLPELLSNGGGMSNVASGPTIINCIFRNNSAQSGGGLYNFQSDPVLTNCTFEANQALVGGGFYNYYGHQAVLYNCNFIGNSATSSGGGYFAERQTEAQMYNCIFRYNTAGSDGGAIYLGYAFWPYASLNNCILSSNSAGGSGGAIASSTSIGSLLNGCVVHNNRAGKAAGGLLIHGGAITNSIVWGNIVDDVSSDPNIVFVDGQPGISHSIIQSGYTGTGSSSADPLFVNSANPAGDDSIFGTADDGLRLQSCSPGIDAGINERITIQTDISGASRFYNGTIDIGPYEYQGNLLAEGLLAADRESSTNNIAAGETKTFMVNGSVCKVAVGMQSTGDQQVTGSITAKVWIDAGQSRQFVKRHFEITPVQNALSATARVTLYATDADFNAFNTQTPAPSILLPLSTDEAGMKASRIANLRIEKRGSSSSDGSGQPSTYSGSTATIDPSDSDIQWNSTFKRWEISFSVTGFGGFFITIPSNPLPVHWVSVDASLNTENQPVISWKVQETTVASYSVQKSLDARKFETIGTLKGQGDGMHQYSFTDVNGLMGKAYYRISQTDLDAMTTLSKIFTLDQNDLQTSTVYPIPARNEVFIVMKSQAGPLDQIVLTDIAGHHLKSQPLLNGSNKINISMLPAGIYLLRTSRGEVFKIFKD